MAYRIEFTDDAREHLRGLTAHDRSTVVAAVRDRLTHEPRRETGNRKRLRPSGGYRKLRSYQVATVIYDATVRFCERFVDKRSRTVDQMVQAARSGGKNIAEGSRAAATTS